MGNVWNTHWINDSYCQIRKKSRYLSDKIHNLSVQVKSKNPHISFVLVGKLKSIMLIVL